MSEIVEFKYRPVDANGNASSFLSKHGRFDGGVLSIDKQQIPAGAIVRVLTRLNRVAIVVNTGESQTGQVLIEVYSNRRQLVTALNRACSATWVEVERRQLAKQGRGQEFRTEMCPVCSCTLGLSRRAVTPQLYCEFCDAVYDVQAARSGTGYHAEDAQYRCCDTCGYFAKPSDFTTFYFYFLFVIYGWRYNRSHRCNSCMRGEAWKMVLVNAPFIVGLFVAIPQLIRAFFGGATMSAKYKGLDSANAAAKSGRTDAAVQMYHEIESRLGHAAGVRFNRGIALATSNRIPEAALAMEESLADCSNYRPAFTALAALYENLGEKAAADGLRAQWIELDLVENSPPVVPT